MHQSSTSQGTRWLVALGVLAFAGACPAPQTTDDGDGPRRVPQLPTCDVDGDCRDNEQCVDGRCHVQCTDASGCGGDRAICDSDRGICVRCLKDADCPTAQVCDDATSECIDDTSAGEGEGEGEGDTGTCTPDAAGCVDEHTAFVCAHDGNSRTTAACRDDQLCIDGACHALVCTPGAAVCSGSSRVVCNANGTATTVTSCNQGCTEPLGCSCVEGQCAPRSCEPNAARCVGNSAQECDALGLGFSDLVDCGADTCTGGRCLADVCTPGDTLCSGRTLLTCNTGGTGFDESTCAEACTGADGSAACTARVCDPLSTTCKDAGTRRVCNADGTASADVPCGDGETCTDGVCQTSECVPQCGGRTCGPDPICGASCGTCAGTCSAGGVCQAPSGPVLGVSLSWTPATEDMDLYLSRDPAEATMCTTDTCFFGTCQASDARPDWDGTGTVSAGDPLLDVADVVHDNPEALHLTLPDGAPAHFRVGADNFGGVDGATAVNATATVRISLDGTVVATHSHAVAIGAQWRGVVIDWDGASLTSADQGTLQADFTCTSPTGGGGNTCAVDGDCPAGQGCISDFLGLTSSCQTVQCTADNQCGGGGQQCSGSHTCVVGPLKGWKQPCSSATECHEGFHCDAITNVCEEACLPQFCAAAGCCPLTGGTTCTPDPLFGITGNCDP